MFVEHSPYSRHLAKWFPLCTANQWMCHNEGNQEKGANFSSSTLQMRKPRLIKRPHKQMGEAGLDGGSVPGLLAMMPHGLPANIHDEQGNWSMREATNKRMSGEERTLLSGAIKAAATASSLEDEYDFTMWRWPIRTPVMGSRPDNGGGT